MKKIISILMIMALVFLPTKALAEELVTSYDDEVYDFYDTDYDDELMFEDEYNNDDDDANYYDDMATDIEDADLDLVNVDELDSINDDQVSLSVCSIIMLALIPFALGIIIGAGLVLLSYKMIKKEKKEVKETKKNDK